MLPQVPLIMESLSSLGILKITTVHRLNKRGTDNSMLVHIEEDTLLLAILFTIFVISKALGL